MIPGVIPVSHSSIIQDDDFPHFGIFFSKLIKKNILLSSYQFILPLTTGTSSYSFSSHKVVPFTSPRRFSYSPRRGGYPSYPSRPSYPSYPSYTSNSVRTVAPAPGPALPKTLASALTAYIDASGELDNCGSMAQVSQEEEQPGPLSLVEECRGSSLIGRELT